MRMAEDEVVNPGQGSTTGSEGHNESSNADTMDLEDENANDSSMDEEEEDEDEEEGDENDGDDESSDSTEEIVPKVLPQRVTRGKRMGRLIGEAAEADEVFWNQAAFQDDESDDEFSSSEAETDETESTDSDIDIPEPEEEDAESTKKKKDTASAGRGLSDAFLDDERGSRNKKYNDPASTRPTRWDFSQAAAAAAAGKAPVAPVASYIGTDGSLLVPREEIRKILADIYKTRGKKPKVSVSETPAEGAADGGAGTKRGKRGGMKDVEYLRQEDILLEAATTTVENLIALDSVARQETEKAARDAAEAAKRGKGRSFPPGLPLLRYHSRRGHPDTLTFTEVDEIPSIINANINQLKRRQIKQ